MLSIAIPHAIFDGWRVEKLQVILEQLGAEIEQGVNIAGIDIIYDAERVGVWPTVKRAWQAGLERPSVTHHLILADDMLPCRDFLAGLNRIIEQKPEECICLFSMRPKVVSLVKARGEHWYTCPNNVYGSAVLMPMAWIAPFLAWCDQHIPEDFKHDDSRLSLYLMQQKKMVWTTVPSLVHHAGNGRSLLGIHIARQEVDWLGDTSALSIDWSKGALHPYRASGSENYAKKRCTVIKAYGTAGDRYPVQVGDIWQVGSHIVACGDIENGDALKLLAFAYEYAWLQPVLVVCDPPWGSGPATSYRTKAGVLRKVDFERFMCDFFAALAHIQGTICIEMGNRQVKQVVRIAEEYGLSLADNQPMYYYKTQPCSCLFFTSVPVCDLVTPMPCADEMVVYRWLIDQFSSIGEIVFDPCIGQGMVAEAAHALGRHILGLELHPRRLAVTLDRLVKVGADTPQKIGELYV